MTRPIFPCLIGWLLCLMTASALGADAPANASSSARAGPVKVRTGVYITSLYDLNGNNNTFTADLWLWFLHDKKLDLKPLKTLEPANARDFKVAVDTSEEHGAERYHAEKARAVFNHNWDFNHFPFDRHELQIRLEEGVADTGDLLYVTDSANTGFDPGIKIDGWRIDKVSIKAGTHTYNSSFGLRETAAGGSSYAASTVSIFIERDGLGLFFKLLIAVYVAFMVSIISFFMDPSKDGIFNGRVGLLVGMVFAVVINSQRVATTLGQTASFTLADKIHALTLISIVFTLICSLISRRFHVRNRGEYADLIDRRLAVGVSIVYVALNLVMIAAAAKR